MTLYKSGDIVVSSWANNRFFERQNDDRSPGLEPAWNLEANAVTEEIDPSNQPRPAWRAHVARNYVVDPLGWEERAAEMEITSFTPSLDTADFRNSFGRLTIAGGSYNVNSPYRIVRFRGGIAGNQYNPANTLSASSMTTRMGATAACVLPDSWQTQTDTFNVLSFTSTSIEIENADLVATLDANGDGTASFAPAGGFEQAINCRVTLYSSDGRQSVVRQVSEINRSASAELISWLTDIPSWLTPTRVRVETFQSRYSWMLAARRQTSGAIYMDLITFYKRSFDPHHELIHPAHFQAGASTVVIQYNPDLGDASPALKRGGFICDAQNNRWYRVINFKEVDNAYLELENIYGNLSALTPQPLQNTRGAIVSLEYAAAESSGIYTSTTNPPPGGALILPGIINVYPLQPRLPWEQ
ncbi:hypothetical protein [Schlesneria sp. DSM 10557]|uniref:hypothetical protein n=1 Tax=Schlesneria sp. DSM 10557 TaxID=3044399 RepID=UPI00359F7FE5